MRGKQRVTRETLLVKTPHWQRLVNDSIRGWLNSRQRVQRPLAHLVCLQEAPRAAAHHRVPQPALHQMHRQVRLDLLDLAEVRALTVPVTVRAARRAMRGTQVL